MDLPSFVTASVFGEIATLATEYILQHPKRDDVTRHVLDTLGEERVQAMAPRESIGAINQSIGRAVRLALATHFGESAVTSKGSRKVTGKFYASFTPHVVGDQTGSPPTEEDPRLVADRDLLAKLKQALPALRDVRDSLREDGIYRFWHQSFKVFPIQDETQRIVDALQAVDPERPLHTWFMQIVADGTGHAFQGRETNEHWLEHTRPIVEAWFHAEHLLSAAIQTAEEVDDATPTLPYPWATVLFLYQLR